MKEYNTKGLGSGWSKCTSCNHDVYYMEKTCSYCGKNPHYGKGEHIVIIGNIYENPEMLNAK